MKFTRKVSVKYAAFVLATLRLTSATIRADDAADYLLTTRIVNRCNPTKNPQGPQVPAPPVATGNALSIGSSECELEYRHRLVRSGS